MASSSIDELLGKHSSTPEARSHFTALVGGILGPVRNLAPASLCMLENHARKLAFYKEGPYLEDMCIHDVDAATEMDMVLFGSASPRSGYRPGDSSTVRYNLPAMGRVIQGEYREAFHLIEPENASPQMKGAFLEQQWRLGELLESITSFFSFGCPIPPVGYTLPQVNFEIFGPPLFKGQPDKAPHVSIIHEDVVTTNAHAHYPADEFFNIRQERVPVALACEQREDGDVFVFQGRFKFKRESERVMNCRFLCGSMRVVGKKA